MIVRGWHFAFDTGEDAALATLYYPGDDRRIGEARLTGQVPALEAEAPWPVVIMMPGINVAPDGYRWLAHRLVADGLCVVTYAIIGSLGPAGQGITPGIDLSALTPDTIGTRPSSTALGPLLAHLAPLAHQAPTTDNTPLTHLAPTTGNTPLTHLAPTTGNTPATGMLDLDRVVIGGHSAGGTVALHNSDPEWVPGLRAVFTYAAHTMTAVDLGHGEGAVLAVPAKVPILLAGGTSDGVISASRDRYHTGDNPTNGHYAAHDPIHRTFKEAIGCRRGDSWLVELKGAGHFAICWPVDTTSGRSYLEPDPVNAEPITRELLGNLISGFIAASLGRGSVSQMEQLVEHPAVNRWERC